LLKQNTSPFHQH